MWIARERFQLSLALVAALFISSVAFAQSTPGPTSDWSVLKTVTSGNKLQIELKNGKTIKGKLSGVSDTALSLTVSGKAVDLSRDDVLRVYQITKKSAKKATLIGLGVGAGAGALLGVAGTANDDGFAKVDHIVTAGFAVLGAGAGALTGYLIGRGASKRVLIYVAPATVK